MRRRTFTRALIALALAGGTTVTTGTAAIADEGDEWGVSWVETADSLTDLQPGAMHATDGASAQVVAIGVEGDGTYVSWYLWDLDASYEGTTYGAHVHVGPCVLGNGAAAGPHYNSGGPPDPEHEVWLDFTVALGGWGWAETWVPFVIPPGAAQSIVVHALPTDAAGNAGGRIACLPVEF